MSIKYAILGLLHYKDMHGYQIKEVIENEFGFMWSINYGQIYPNLKALEDEGLVTKMDVAQKNAPDKKLYSITEKGKEAFTDWLTAAPERAMLIRDPFLLKFVFFSFGEEQKALDVIDDQIENYTKGLAERKARYRTKQSESVYVRLMRELGISLNEMMLEWLNRAKADIEIEAANRKPEKEAPVRAKRINER
jgi:PadR family transcriptional regulator AphA